MSGKRASAQKKTPAVGAGASQQNSPNQQDLTMANRKVTCEVVNVTPAIAAHLRKTAHFERQRKISPHNVERLKLEMLEGRFIDGTPVLVCVLPDGSGQIVNGNHTLEAVAASGRSQMLTFIYYHAKDMEDVAKAYATFDIHRARSWGDALRAYGLEDKVDMAKYVMSAVGLIQNGLKDAPNTPVSQSREVRFELLEEYKAPASIIASALSGAPKENSGIVRRSAVLAVALTTAKYQPSSAFEFWNGMAMDHRLDRDDPRKTLLTFLRNIKGQGSTYRNTQILAAKMCWNAFFRGETYSCIKTASIKNDPGLSGTPYSTSKREREAPAAPSPLFKTGMRCGPDGQTPETLFVMD